MELFVTAIAFFIYGLLVERIMAKFHNFHDSFWDALAMGPVWRFIARIRKS